MHLDTIFTLFLIATLSFMTGCKTPTHAEAKVQAEQRWSKVRGQVKLQLARQQFERGRFEDTIKTLKEATSLDQTSAESFALLAKCNLELGKPTTAEQVLATAAKLADRGNYIFAGGL
jgi:Tfp pilus assembly protein PilF